MSMKKAMILATSMVVSSMACGASAVLRVDTRGEGWIATGVERIGSADGGSVREWDTTKLADGWTTVESGGVQARVLVLNGPSVEGGRLAGNAAWGAERTHVVRHDVVVGAGKTLTLGAGAIVKFAGEAKLVAENGGRIVAEGALLADLADDSVGGDVNLDGGASEASGEWAEWVPEGAGLVEVSLWDGAAKAAPPRTYTAGRALGTLPVLERDGAVFEGWRTEDGESVDAETLAEEGMIALYASWKVLELAIEPGAAETGAAGTTLRVAVTANGAWTAVSDGASPWLSVASGASGEGNGEVRVKIEGNPGAEGRTGTVRVQLVGDSMMREFTVSQAGREPVATPVVSPGDGFAFQANAQRVVVTCTTEGAVIRYTLDGSEPNEKSAIASSLGFNVFDTTVVKAKAWAEDMLPSTTAEVRLVRLQTLAEALDVPLWNVTSDAEGGWSVDIDTSNSGGSSAKSGEVAENGRSAMATSVSGSGTLKFRWKASCEDDPDDTWRWDHLEFRADGEERAHLDGETSWEEVAVELGEGSHALEWAYAKDNVGTVGEDCGWVDAVSWTPTVALEGETAIPVAWFENQGLVALGGTAEDAAAADPDGDGMTTAQEYMAGTDPNDPGSVLAVMLVREGELPDVEWSPRLGTRHYRVWAKKEMTDEEWSDVTDVPHRAAQGWRFFAVSVESGE